MSSPCSSSPSCWRSWCGSRPSATPASASNAAVSEDTKLLGLIGGRRRLYLGMPLLQALSVDQLRSVVAHELGHYSGKHTRLGAVAYRGRLAIGHTIGRIGPWNPVGWTFRGYARLYLLVDNAVSRRQELDADRASVRVAGPEVAVAALRELPVIDAAWGFYFDRYINQGWEAGFAPDDFFGGFGRLVAARHEELAKLRDDQPEEHRSRWDTHPSHAERIALMRTAPQVAHPVAGRPRCWCSRSPPPASPCSARSSTSAAVRCCPGRSSPRPRPPRACSARRTGCSARWAGSPAPRTRDWAPSSTWWRPAGWVSWPRRRAGLRGDREAGRLTRHARGGPGPAGRGRHPGRGGGDRRAPGHRERLRHHRRDGQPEGRRPAHRPGAAGPRSGPSRSAGPGSSSARAVTPCSACWTGSRTARSSELVG
jgi:hypothetical protein